jgi:6-phosphogluconolactonase
MRGGHGMARRRFLGVLGTVTAAGASVGAVPAAAEPRSVPRPGSRTRRAYLGTYTSGQPNPGPGVGLADYDPATGQLTTTGVLAGVANPSFLALDAAGRTLYAVNEQADGGVTACAVTADGLRVRDAQPTGGADPCHLSVHPGGRFLLTANYTSGSVTVHPIRADGGLGAPCDLVQHHGSGPDPDRQAGPHAHMVRADPWARHVLAVDLGTDSVYAYALDPRTGRLRPVRQNRLAAGSGPRHLAFHPSGRICYVVNELASTVVVCGYHPATGALTPGATYPTAPTGDPGERNYPAEVLVSADGRFVYVSNRGHDSVAVFATDRDGAALRPLGSTPSGGHYPRHIALDPSGRLLVAANQGSGTVAAFAVDARHGTLAPLGRPLTTPTPVCALLT